MELLCWRCKKADPWIQAHLRLIEELSEQTRTECNRELTCRECLHLDAYSGRVELEWTQGERLDTVAQRALNVGGVPTRQRWMGRDIIHQGYLIRLRRNLPGRVILAAVADSWMLLPEGDRREKWLEALRRGHGANVYGPGSIELWNRAEQGAQGEEAEILTRLLLDRYGEVSPKHATVEWAAHTLTQSSECLRDLAQRVLR